MSIIYATSGDYTAYADGAAPANIDALLRSASRLVTRQLSTAIYDVDDDGLPTDAGNLQAVKDATCEQVTVWQALGIDPAAQGLLAPQGLISSKSLDGGAIAYDNGVNGTVAALQVRQQAVDHLADSAALILQESGLTSTRVWTYG